MQIYHGKELDSFVADALKGIERSRFLLKDLDSYMQSENNRKVCCLYGLRRTGKTVMVEQEIKKLGGDNCVLIRCEEGDYTFGLKKAMQEYKDVKNIFIDEATILYDFIEASAFLADHYAASGAKVVLAGTDSLGFLLARSNALYDRADFLHTTYIPYAEYNHVLGKDLMSYIKYGGTLSPEGVFYNKQKLNEYSNSAIVYNLIHSLDKWEAGTNVGLALLGEIPINELPSFINKVIEIHNRSFLMKVMNDDFHSHDLGSLAQLMSVNDIADPSLVRTKDMEDRVRICLGIKENPLGKVNEQARQTIIDYLEKMDVLYHIPNSDEYIFTQTGMRYCQASALAYALVTSEEFGHYTEVEQRDILQKLESDICGGILENIVYYQIVNELSDNKDMSVTKYTSIDGKEIDVLINDFERKSSIALEVKLSDKIKESQTRHLLNEQFCKEVETKSTGIPITSKAVIYMGKTKSNREVSYINAEEFLTNVKGQIERLYNKQGRDEHSSSQQSQKPKFDYADQ